MPSKNQTVMKLNKKTHNTIREYATEYGTTPPKMLDTIVDLFDFQTKLTKLMGTENPIAMLKRQLEQEVRK